jgi:hypothetical protein
LYYCNIFTPFVSIVGQNVKTMCRIISKTIVEQKSVIQRISTCQNKLTLLTTRSSKENSKPIWKHL